MARAAAAAADHDGRRGGRRRRARRAGRPPDRRALPARRARRRHDALHVGHHRPAQGREAPAPAEPAARRWRWAAPPGCVLGLDGKGPHLVTGPLYHAAPLGFAAIDLANGSELVVMPRWDESQCLRLIQERAVRNSHVVPTMCVRLLRLPEEERAAFDPSSLSTVLHGAAPIAPSTKHQMIEWWGPVLTEYWGSTEGGVFTLVDSDGLAHQARHGRQGDPHLRGVRRRRRRRAPARRARSARSTPTTSSPTRCSSTTRPRRRPTAAHLAPGTFTMGDVGHVDEDGYVFLSDRAANMIISGGVNIYPAEIEQVLIDHPAVADVAVFGIPDEEWGEQVKAAVELQDGYEPSAELEADLLLFARAAAGRVQGAPLGRLRGRAAAPPHRQALHAPAPRQVLAGPGDRGVSVAGPGLVGVVTALVRRSERLTTSPACPIKLGPCSNGEYAPPPPSPARARARRGWPGRPARTPPGGSGCRGATSSAARWRRPPRCWPSAPARVTTTSRRRAPSTSRRSRPPSRRWPPRSSAATASPISTCSSTSSSSTATRARFGSTFPQAAAATATPASTRSTGSTSCSGAPTRRWRCSRPSRCSATPTRSRPR